LRDIHHLRHGEGLQVDLRKALLEPGNQVDKILKREIRMQSPDNMEFRDGFGITGGSGLERLFQRHGVRARRVLLAPKRTKAAGRHANIGGIQMAVDVEVRLVAVQAFAYLVRDPAYS